MNLSLQYLYYIGKYADAYMMGELKIRDVIDYYLYVHKQIPETEQASDKEILEKAGLTEFMKQFGILASLWFGQGREADPTQAFLLEEYIFSKGMEERRPDSSIIPFEKISLDFYQRDREEEWGKRQKEWMFPSREYMVQFSRFYKRFRSSYGYAGGFEESDSSENLRLYLLERKFRV